MIDHEKVWCTRGSEEERWVAQHAEGLAKERKRAEYLQARVDEIFEPQLFRWVKAMLIWCWRLLPWR